METRRRGRLWWAGLLLMGIFYVFSGTVHLLNPGFYVPVVPSYVPWPLAMVYISGVAEILGGIGVVMPDGFVFRNTRMIAAWGLVALLIAVLPVHINMCLHPEQFPAISRWVAWVRLPLQIPLIAWAWFYTRR